MNSPHTEDKQSSLILGNKTLKQITEDISVLTEKIPGVRYLLSLAGAKTLFIFYLIVMSIIVAVVWG